MMKKALLLFATALWCSFSASAQQAGTLDVSFGQQGIVETGFGAGLQAMAMEILADGKIMVVGSHAENDVRSLIVLQYLPDGAPDILFGNAGKKISELPPLGYLMFVKINPADGSLLLGSGGVNSNLAITRYSPAGEWDTFFGNGGIVTEPFNYVNTYADALFLPDGKILVGAYGYAFSPSHLKGYLIRFNADGTLDTSFGEEGYAPIFMPGNQILQVLALQADGKILAAGHTHPGTTSSLPWRTFVARLHPDGNIDEDFGTGGSILLGIGVPASILLRPDGKIIVGGGLESLDNPGLLYIEQLLANGIPDISFGTSGRVSLTTQRPIKARPKLERTVSGQLVLYTILQYQLGLWRFHDNGSPDTSFGNQGLLTADFDNGQMSSNIVILHQQDRLLITGTLHRDDILLGRLLHNGSLDTNFGKAGFSITDLGSHRIYAGPIAAFPDGRIQTSALVGNRFVSMRYLPNGNLDHAYGQSGLASVRLPHHDYVYDISFSIDAQGGIAALISIEEENKSIYIARLRPDGTPEQGFGTDGLLRVVFGLGDSYGGSVSILENGKILIAGTFANTNGIHFFAMSQFLPDGQADQSFGNGGVAISQTANNAFCSNMAVLPDGKILLTGNQEPVPSRLISARYFSNGFIDASFGSFGRVETAIGQQLVSSQNISLQSDGKILIAGSVEGKAILVRYLPDGTLDSEFGNAGVFISDNLTGWKTQVRVQLDGTLFLVGGQRTNNIYTLTVMQLNAQGMPEPNFGTDGFAVLPTARDMYLNGSELLSDHKLVLAGSTNTKLYLARFHTHLSVSTTERHPEAIPLLVWPNPADEMLYVEYTLPRAGRVHIRLFDVYGRPLQTLLQPDQRAEGPQHEQFRLPDALPTGVYWLSLEADQKSAAVKVVRR